jgi:hypothetical protein
LPIASPANHDSNTGLSRDIDLCCGKTLIGSSNGGGIRPLSVRRWVPASRLKVRVSVEDEDDAMLRRALVALSNSCASMLASCAGSDAKLRMGKWSERIVGVAGS